MSTFARPDSVVEGMGVYDVRKRIGAELARESGVPADVVVPVPDSGVPAAIGYAQESGLDFELGIIRNHYVGRTFIEPTDHIRNLGVKLKHNANRVTLAGKRVVLVDDSIVRGTTSTKIVGMVRAAGATEVHMRIASPPTTHSCFYGVDTPERSKLLAANHSVDEMARLIGVDSLAFLSIDGLYRAVGEARRDKAQPQYCDACFSGDYPTRLADIEGELGGEQLSLHARGRLSMAGASWRARRPGHRRVARADSRPTRCRQLRASSICLRRSSSSRPRTLRIARSCASSRRRASCRLPAIRRLGRRVLLSLRDTGGARELVLEEQVGPVPCRVRPASADMGHAEFDLPRLPARESVKDDRAKMAQALGLTASEVGGDAGTVEVWSAGNPFTFAPLSSLDAIRRCRVDLATFDEAFRTSGRAAAFVFTRETTTHFR